MKAFFLALYQLPQNIIGYFVMLFTGAKPRNVNIDGKTYTFYQTVKYRFGVSLGYFIIIGSSLQPSNKTIKHEYGHQIQSKILGPLYLLLVGIPSFLRCTWDIFAHTNWKLYKREEWYYKGYPEKWADKLGGVNR